MAPNILDREKLNSLIMFLIVTFGLAYILDLIILIYRFNENNILYTLLLIVRMYTPFIGVLVVGYREGENLRNYLKKNGLVIGRVKTIIPSLLTPYVIYGIGVLIAMMAGISVSNPVNILLMQLGSVLGGLERVSSTILLVLILVSSAINGLTINTIAALGEEIGWRGFLLEIFRHRYGVLSSSVLIGVIWGLWHAPLIVLLGYNYPMHRDIYGVTMFTVVCIAWTMILVPLKILGNSVIYPSIMHGTLNALGGIMLLSFYSVDRLIGLPIGILSAMASGIVAAGYLLYLSLKRVDIRLLP